MAPRRKRQRLSAAGEGESAVAGRREEEGRGDDADDADDADGADGADAAVEHAEKHAHSDKHAQAAPRRTLFVRSLPFTATTESLTEFFSQSYPLKHATVVLDAVTKKSKGYGFVTFADSEDAQSAKNLLDGSVFEGRKIRVEIAEPRHREIASGIDLDGQRKSVLSAASAEAKAERKRKHSEARRPPKLIVRNLPWSVKKPEQLAALFQSYGRVKQASVPTKKPGLLAGFGFVVMRGRRNAEKAIAGVNGTEVDGRQIAVDWAVEKDVWEGLQNEGEMDAEMDGAETDGLDVESEDREAGGIRLGHEEPDPDTGGSDESSEYGNDGSEGSLEDEGGDSDEEEQPQRTQDNSSTLFIRNLPFSSTDGSLREHFSQFGPVRYARVVMDHATDRPRGTAFVCFYNEQDADSCVRQAPRSQFSRPLGGKGGEQVGRLVKHSVLQDEGNDPTGLYTMDGRVLQVTRAVDRSEAAKLNEISSELRNRRDIDKRRLFLLSEGTIPSNSPLYNVITPSERTMREASLKQRKALLQSNPSLHLSLTRLSVRNIPRSITSKDLKALAREGVVGFAKDVKISLRQQLSKEEESRGGDEMKEAERLRKAKGKGIVKQAKVVFEGREGGKVPELSGAGRSRGYGFIEYTSHRWALMGLRWLNGHAVGQSMGEGGKDSGREAKSERMKRLIVEFAIENAQVVARRMENEAKARERSKLVAEKRAKGELPNTGKKPLSKDALMAKTRKGSKRKRGSEKNGGGDASKGLPKTASREDRVPSAEQEKLAKRQKIIARKRMMRRSRAKGASG